MFGVDNTGSPLDMIAHIIQVALTPVFLLSGIATQDGHTTCVAPNLATFQEREDAVGTAG
jgi:hypothetical protein